MTPAGDNVPPVVLFAKENATAEGFIDAGDLRSAAGILVDIVQKDPSNWRAFNNMGILSWMQKAWQDAYAMFVKAATLKPDYGDALINLFDAGLKLKRINDILPLLEKGLEQDPGMEEIGVIVESIKAQGDEIYSSERALHIGTYNPKVESATKLLEDGKLFAAMEKYLDVVENDGPNADAFSGLGTISYYQKRYDDAFALFVESIKINPANHDNFMNLLDAAKATGRGDAAKKIFELYRKEIPSLESLADEFSAL